MKVKSQKVPGVALEYSPLTLKNLHRHGPLQLPVILLRRWSSFVQIFIFYITPSSTCSMQIIQIC